MAFSIDSPKVRIAELTMEVGRRWDWKADLITSVVPNQLSIVVDDVMVGYLDTKEFQIVEYGS